MRALDSSECINNKAVLKQPEKSFCNQDISKQLTLHHLYLHLLIQLGQTPPKDFQRPVELSFCQVVLPKA